MGKEKRLSWFKVFGANLGAFEAITPEKGWNGFLSALRYLNNGNEQILADVEEKIVYSLLKQSIIDGQAEYDARRKAGKEAAEKRWKEALKKAVADAKR